MQGRNERKMPRRKRNISYRATAAVCLLAALLLFSWSYFRAIPQGELDEVVQWTPVAPENATKQLTAETGSSFLVVEPDSFLDPRPGNMFVVALELRIDDAPAPGKLAKFIYKFTPDTPPYPGWAIGLHTYETSLRPEVYWESADGQGGWYTFDEVQLKRSSWYVFVLVADDKLLSLYLQEAVPGEHEGEGAVPAARRAGKVPLIFLGGYKTGELALPQSSGRLYIRSGASAGSGFQSTVGQVLICQAMTQPPTSEALRLALSGGVPGISKACAPGGISLWIDETGKDRSQYERPIKTSANNL